MMASLECDFPVEQWWQVLVNVPPKDLCNVVLTSRHMNRVASLPELWAGMKVNLRRVRENGLAEMYKINRFKKIKQMDFSTRDFTLEQIESILNDIPESPLVNISLKCVILTTVTTDLLARAVCHLRSVNLTNSELTTKQCVRFLEASISANTLVDVDLDCINLSQVPAELLSRAICRLETISLRITQLTNGQFIQVLEASLSSNTLHKINLSHINLSEVPPELLAMALNRLTSIDFSRTEMTTEQYVRILEATSLSSSTLAHVDLNCNDLSEVPAELLARALVRLKTIDLSHTDMTTEQCVGVLEASVSSNTLVYVNLEGNAVSEVPSELLARAVSQLKRVAVGGSYHHAQLTTEQCVKILETSVSSNTLANANLFCYNLSGVPAELLARAVSGLKTAYIFEITTEQCIRILETSLSSNTLVNLSINYINLSQVPEELLSTAICRLKTISLVNTKMTYGQSIKVLEAILSSNTLVNVNLHDINLSQVPAKLLSTAICRLQTIRLERTKLTSDQSIRILEAILSSHTLINVDLECIDLSEVSADLLARAVSRLKTIDLSHTNMTTDQCVRVLEASLSSNTLTNVVL